MNENSKHHSFNRRHFALAAAGLFAAPGLLMAHDDKKENEAAEEKPLGPREKPFERDYNPPKFKPSWKNEQVNRELAADFVIYAHSDLKMVEKLLAREPGLLNATLDWGGGDWEDAISGASHMGRRDIVEFLLSKGARPNLFCAAMMGLLPAVKAMLELQSELINAKGPHGFSLHWHAQVGLDEAKPVLDYLQSIKEVELKPLPPMFFEAEKVALVLVLEAASSFRPKLPAAVKFDIPGSRLESGTWVLTLGFGSAPIPIRSFGRLSKVALAGVVASKALVQSGLRLVDPVVDYLDGLARQPICDLSPLNVPCERGPESAD